MRQRDPSLFFANALRLKRVIASAVASLMLLVLTGCQIPQLRYAQTAPPLPSDFNGVATEKNSAQLGIDQFFDDPVLTSLIAQGLAGSQELKILNQEVQIASAEILARRGAYLPFLNARAGTGLTRSSLYTTEGAAEEQLTFPDERHFPSPLGDFSFGVDFLWRLDLWRELRNARDAAAQRYVAAIERRNFFVTQLVAEIADNYYELAALDQRLAYLNQTITLQQQSLEAAEAFKAAGRNTELGVQRFLAEVRRNQSERYIVQQNIVQVENRINLLVGRYPQAVDRQQWDFITLDSRALSVGVPAQLLLNRRDIREAERELTASGLDIKVARARFFPTVDITGTVGLAAFNPRYLFTPEALVGKVAADLVGPLINKKAIQADYMTANARQLQAVYNYQRTVISAFIEVANSIAKVENYRNSVQIKQQQVEALEYSVQLAMQLYQAVQLEYVDVLLAQRDLLEARISLVEAKQQQLSAIVNAYQALGGGYLSASPVQGPTELYPSPAYLGPDGVAVPPAPSEPPAPPPPGKVTLPSPEPASE